MHIGATKIRIVHNTEFKLFNQFNPNTNPNTLNHFIFTINHEPNCNLKGRLKLVLRLVLTRFRPLILLNRGGHFGNFLILSIIKNDFFAFFIRLI